MGVYNKDERGKALQYKQQIEQGLKDGTITRQDIEAERQRIQQNSPQGRLGKGLEFASGYFANLAGRQQKQPSALDELVQLQTQQMKQSSEDRAVEQHQQNILKTQQDMRLKDAKAKAEADKVAREIKDADVLAKKEQALSGGQQQTTPIDATTRQTAIEQTPLLPQTVEQQLQPGLIETQRTEKTGGVTQTFKDLVGELKLESAKKSQEEGIAIQKGQRMSFNNLEKVAGGIRNGAEVFAQAVRKNQAGNSLAAARTRLVSGRIGNIPLPGGTTTQREFGDVGSQVEGTINESLFNMIPMLTQQGDKAGSVRLMSTVINRLGLSLPRLETDIVAARGMWDRTLRSFFRFARAAELSGIEFDKSLNLKDATDEDMSDWVSKVVRAADRVELSDEEETAISKLVSNTLEPVDQVIDEQTSGEDLQIISIEPIGE